MDETDSFFREMGLFQTAAVFRQETGAQFSPVPFPSLLSPLSPIAYDVPGENSLEQQLIINKASQSEKVALPDDDGSSNRNEDNIRQQSDAMPSAKHELKYQIVDELTVDDIFDCIDKQGPAPVVEAGQSSKMASDEFFVGFEDVWNFSIPNDLIEPSSLVKGKKKVEGDSGSQDGYLYDSSSFDIGNEDGRVISAFNFDKYHEAPDNGEIQGVTVGGNLVLQSGPHSVAQTVPRTTELASNEVILSGRKRKWFEVSGDEGECSIRSAHMYGSSCGKGNEDDGASHQN